MQRARDASVSLVADERVHGWIVCKDSVLVHAAAVALGATELEGLATHFESQDRLLEAARVRWAVAMSMPVVATWTGGMADDLIELLPICLDSCNCCVSDHQKPGVEAMPGNGGCWS